MSAQYIINKALSGVDIDDANEKILQAMHEFAAQEVEEYKKRLKEAIHGYYLNSFRENEFLGIIDEI